MANRVMGYVICGYNSVDNLMSEQSSPFRRWTTGSGAGSSYRHHDHRNMYNKQQMSEGSTPVSPNTNGASSNVARWSLGLEQLLADPAGAAAFAHFLTKEFASENLRFWWACEQYSTTAESGARRALAAEIWSRHLDEKAPEPVNVDAAARRAALRLMCHDPPPPDIFLLAQKQIFNVMKFDSYPRFLRSPEHAECARADLRGLPPPYRPAAAASADTSNDNSPTKLKKSASNVSDRPRRRSGGASLLPWKLRHASRDRLDAPREHPLTDVVKCSQATPGPGQGVVQGQGQAQLCRVVLPDGATSVVSVDAAVSVGSLVDKLLHRRNLACNTYDVLLKDPAQGEAAGVETQAPSTSIGGREVVVERRAVVRLEVCGRCVAVRCRAQRRLRHVLRPVLHKYRLHPEAEQRVHVRTPAGAHVHPDTLMQDLDGCRLQVVEISDNGEVLAESLGSSCDGATGRRDSDADSLTDVALRPDERDSQSNSTTSSRSNSGVNNTGAGAPSAGVACPGGGRVRAALRPGPPLHHHPPDFLENLRETQRARFQGKDTSPPPPSPLGATCLPAPPTPRTPPPLPPKPAHRPTPTVV